MTSIRDKFLLRLFLIWSLFYICGCTITSHGRMDKIKRSQVDTIQVNVSTKKDIVTMLGKPQKIIYKPNNNEIYIYIHGVERSIGIPFLLSWSRSGGTGQTINIAFDQYGIVTDYEYVTDERGMIE